VTGVSSESTAAQRMVAAATRLRQAWRLPDLDVDEMHQAVMGLIVATEATDLQSALVVLHDVESGHAYRSN
jgi:hypothetical protein